MFSSSHLDLLRGFVPTSWWSVISGQLQLVATDPGQERRRSGADQSRHQPGATMSHMEVGVRELRNRTGKVIAAVRSGERVTLTVRGEPVADIVPHGERYRWLAGDRLRRQLGQVAADSGLRAELDELAGQTLGEL